MKIPVPQPAPPTTVQKIDIATEFAFNALIAEAQNQGLKLWPVGGLMYLPRQDAIVSFQQACRLIVALLIQTGPPTNKPTEAEPPAGGKA